MCGRSRGRRGAEGLFMGEACEEASEVWYALLTGESAREWTWSDDLSGAEKRCMRRYDPMLEWLRASEA